ncbi:alpha/beta-hydrolase [Zopfia rhizophila CBS 207.26]|uniref:Carboxylic ester hydrolase n=1 Tax=Zopfia rhizophila CBS 207.26 TaxID=1314779 RepID=A0A6A6EN85_9PEZI|nr:alpha/beta-hydrolase [Zopfia rhizophila CBS 207.26]
MYLNSVAVALLTILAQAICDPVDDALSVTPTATLAKGVIRGTTTSIAGDSTSLAVNKFLGIPFATPPVGSLRFTPPKPTSWAEPKDAKEFKSACIQVFSPLSDRNFTEAVFNTPTPNESEDCLYLNVFAPKKPWNLSKSLFPVLYWMYGGAMKFGNAGQPAYDGSNFAALEDVIVVSVNYRTNVFGFPMAPAISNITERNLGLLDQRAGLDWIQRNIEKFGGDKTRITVFGESAGAYSTDILLTSAWPNGSPFSSAIMESGSYAYLPIPNCNNTDYRAWQSLIDALGCTNASPTPFQCVKEKNASDVKTAQEFWNIAFGQACDNITYVSDPRLRRERGEFAQVPVIEGSNAQDGSYYAFRFGNNTELYFQTYFKTMTQEWRNKILEAYPLGTEGRVDNVTRLIQIHTDWNFHCPATFNADSSTKFVDTYRYLFNATFPNTRIRDPRWSEQYQGAWHTSEIPIVFSTYPREGFTDEERRLSDTMRHAWASFARDPKQPPLEG